MKSACARAGQLRLGLSHMRLCTSCCMSAQEGQSQEPGWPVALPQSYHHAYGIANADHFCSWAFKYVHSFPLSYLLFPLIDKRTDLCPGRSPKDAGFDSSHQVRFSINHPPSRCASLPILSLKSDGKGCWSPCSPEPHASSPHCFTEVMAGSAPSKGQGGDGILS